MAIKFCPCANETQDKWYGRNMRVHNRRGGKKMQKVQYTCTACGKQVIN